MGYGRRTSRNGRDSVSLNEFGNVPDLYAVSDARKSVDDLDKAKKSGERTRTRAKTANKTKAKKPAAPEQNAPKTKPVVPVPSETKILKAVASLYADRLRPFGRILRKRLAERSEADDAQECDLIQLRKACEESGNLRLTSEEGGEWSAILLDQAEDFIDVYDKQDEYPEALWSAADSYFQSLAEEEAILPGGRYACAQALATRNLHFLQGFSLGHICHFVQLAISTRKILGYLNGGITSYRFSHSCAKDRAAAQQSSCAQTASVSELQIADWDIARRCLRDIMKDALNHQSNQVPLSNIKRIFRSQFEIELSETALGHSKLSELLQDECLNDICTVRLLDQGYFVIPMFEISDSQSDGHGTESTAFSWADVDDDEILTTDSDDVGDVGDDVGEQVGGFCGTPCWLDEVDQHGRNTLRLNVDADDFAFAPPLNLDAETFGFVQRNTFLHAATSPLVKLPKQRSHSVPRCVGRTYLESPCLNLESPAELMPPTPEMCATPEMWVGLPSASDWNLQSVPESQPVEKFSWNTPGAEVVLPAPDPFLEQYSMSQELHFVVENTFISSVPVLAAPTLRSRSVPRSHPRISDEFSHTGMLDELLDDEEDQFPASMSMLWSVEPSMYTLEPCKSAVQISLADHV